jgi:hypothetical protein
LKVRVLQEWSALSRGEQKAKFLRSRTPGYRQIIPTQSSSHIAPLEPNPPRFLGQESSSACSNCKRSTQALLGMYYLSQHPPRSAFLQKVSMWMNAIQISAGFMLTFGILTIMTLWPSGRSFVFLSISRKEVE